MKKCCKHIDITDRKFISTAVYRCLEGKHDRRDVLQLLSDYSGIPFSAIRRIAKAEKPSVFWWRMQAAVERLIDDIRHEILTESWSWKPIWYSTKREGRKDRRIGIQDIKQQLYDYIAVAGLQELFDKKIGYYQCAALPGKGQVFGMRAIKRWLRSSKARYAWKGDAHHYYENIDRDKLKELLIRYVDNALLLKLVFALIDSFEKGLSIGSYLSQYLANFYMSFAYHYAGEQLHKTRRCRNGLVKRVSLIGHVLIYMDDILFISSDRRNLKMAVRQFVDWISKTLGITVKPEQEWIDLQAGYIDMMGFCVSKRKTIVRNYIFRRFRRAVLKVRKAGRIRLPQAKRITSLYGWPKNSDCRHWLKKHKVRKILNYCKGAIRHGKDVVYITAGKGEDCCAA